MYGLLFACSIFVTVFLAESRVGETMSNGQAIGLWVAGDNAYGLCVVAVNLGLWYRQGTPSKIGNALYILSAAGYFIALGV